VIRKVPTEMHRLLVYIGVSSKGIGAFRSLHFSNLGIVRRSSSAPNATPMMAQFLKIKAQHKDSLLLFQLGGFLECFFEDAVLLSSVLNITLTSRGYFNGKPVPMAGIPMHARDSYIARLVKANIKVVICEQTEGDTNSKFNVIKSSSSLIPRQVTRIVTRGTVLEDTLLTSNTHNYLSAISLSDSNQVGIAWIDLSTGDFLVSVCPSNEFSSQIAMIPPSELLVPDLSACSSSEVEKKMAIFQTASSQSKLLKKIYKSITELSSKHESTASSYAVADLPQPRNGLGNLLEIPSSETDVCSLTFWSSEHFDGEVGSRELSGLCGLQEAELASFPKPLLEAIGALLRYVEWTHGSLPRHIRSPVFLSAPGEAAKRDATPARAALPRMRVDGFTRRGLELARPLHGRRRARGSLLHALDGCATAMGSRMLDHRLAAPLAAARPIRARLEAVDFFAARPSLRETARALLRRAPDLERALQRVLFGRFQPRDFVTLRDGLRAASLLGGCLATLDHVVFHPSSDHLLERRLALLTGIAKPTASEAQRLVMGAQLDFDRTISPSGFNDRNEISILNDCTRSLNLVYAASVDEPPGVADKVLEERLVSETYSLLLRALIDSSLDAPLPSPSSSDPSDAAPLDSAYDDAERELDLAPSQPETTIAAYGSYLKSGFSKELDEARRLRDDTSNEVNALQEKLRAMTGIRSLRVKRTDEMGSSAEVPAKFVSQLEAYNSARQKERGGTRSENDEFAFIHVRTLKNSSRYKCGALSNLDAQIANAAARAAALEEKIYRDLRASVQAASSHLTAIARALAVVDLSVSLADLASRYGLCRPNVLLEEDAPKEQVFQVTGARHLVVEKALLEGWSPLSDDSSESPHDEDFDARDLDPRTLPKARSAPRSFVPNDIVLGASTPPQTADGTTQASTILLCGPNMGGKSTYLRSAAHIAILSHIGSYVPATSVTLSPIDCLFSRIGASDDVTRDRSTFLVEMEETAVILKNATPSSFVVIDEVGRGTSAADGMALAWAILEFLTLQVKCRTLFASHIHELTSLALPSMQPTPLDPRGAPRYGPLASAVRCMTVDVVLPGASSREVAGSGPDLDLSEESPLLTHRIVPHPVYQLARAMEGGLEALSPSNGMIGGAADVAPPNSTPQLPVTEKSAINWNLVASMSYGVHVAHLARLPPSVLARAKGILKKLDQARAGEVWARALLDATSTSI
jgi:DNA mismatch repair ATPase MutS